MGTLRVFLALCVVISHSGDSFLGFELPGGYQAVQLFFIISGFYMEFILSTKYNDNRSFYINRFLRIFIPYWGWLLTIIVFDFIILAVYQKTFELAPYLNSSFRDQYHFFEIFFVTVANVGIFFQDVITLLNDSKILGLEPFLMINPAWSIGIELTLYLLVPLLHKLKTINLSFIIVFFISLRLYSYWHWGINEVVNHGFGNRFFPFELPLFIMGMLSCRLFFKLQTSNFKQYWY